MKAGKKQLVLSCLAVALILALTVASGLALRRTLMENSRREAEHILYYYGGNITLQLRGNLNSADALAQMALVMGEESDWFDTAAAPLLEREEVRYLCLIRGDTMVKALPASEFGAQVGRELKDFSYIFTLAKVVKELVVEGPVTLDGDGSGREVFLFLEPIVKDNAYLGEVAVGLDCGYVLEQFGLDGLSAQGYDYELWRVDPQNGGKEVIAASGGVDFSHAAKMEFNLPSLWNLSIQPSAGWIRPGHRAGLILFCALEAALLLTLAWALSRLRGQGRTLRELAVRDAETGLYNRAGFTAALDRLLAEGKSAALFYFVFEGYNQAAQLMGPDGEADFLRGIPQRLRDYIRNAYVAGRVGAGCFIVAVRENMGGVEREDFARGLSLELLLKFRLRGEKRFLTARYVYADCRPGEGGAAEAVDAVIQEYYARLSGESPARMLTEKCRRLIAGQSDVVFDEYTDLDMMELSKTFNQYRKQVEQLAYFDPVFNVGNRPKFFRDVNMLISYDKKRRFSLFCVDICAFSHYNELFSAEIGDQILQEVLNRLSRPFGTYLYRINGDVFLGISLAGEDEVLFAQRLQELISRPVTAGSAAFALQVRVAVCRYPTYGDSPVALLDRVQSALRFAKESNQKIVIYSQELDGLVRTEADILHRLKQAVQLGTLEVWYQPLVRLESGRYSAVEALVRLPDGRGGYFSAGQVIALAERNGMVEELGDYVLGRACRFMKARGGALGLLRMGINLSVQQLLVGNSAGHLLELIRSAGADTGRITLEITESVLIQSIERASAALDKLRQAGVHIALDDFGVGYSSLNYLSNLPVDVIKIDRSLTQEILTNPKQHALLRSIVEVAGINGLGVVAEGVESGEEQAVIAASGVQYIQGYYYARPMPEEALIRFLEDAGGPQGPA